MPRDESSSSSSIRTPYWLAVRVDLPEQRDLGGHEGALTGTACDSEVAAEQGYPLAHAREADPFTGADICERLRREAPPVV